MKKSHKHQVNGIFIGLSTGTNYFRDELVQFHIFSDSYEQMKLVLAVHKDACASFTPEVPKLFFTDDPFGDKKIFHAVFPNLKHTDLIFSRNINNKEDQEVNINNNSVLDTSPNNGTEKILVT